MNIAAIKTYFTGLQASIAAALEAADGQPFRADGDDTGVRYSPLNGDREELLDDFQRSAQRFHSVLRFDFGFKYGRSDEHSRAMLPESLHKRAVVKLADHPGPELIRLAPPIQAQSHCRVHTLNQQRRAVQAGGKLSFEALE